MSNLINISDHVYEELTELKKIRKESYTEVIDRFIHSAQEKKKTRSWDDLIARAKERDAKFKGKKEKIDHDLIAYGASRDSS
ncbi:MAG TPA: antitoxin VapB family protein [Candidatus Bilamarchaeaceae archaeon]|nr:antitoxin VapB family protein [Candidatus Bilamarchaeaceae archaeon]